MTYPSVKTIASIEWLSNVGDPTAIAKKIRKVMESWHCDWLIEYALSLDIPVPNHVYRYDLIELQLWVIDRLLDCHGVEAIMGDSYSKPDIAYCNTGDTYASTVAYDYTRDKFVITSWGDFVERNDPNGTKY